MSTSGPGHSKYNINVIFPQQNLTPKYYIKDLYGVDGSPFCCSASSSVCSGISVRRVIVCVAIFLGVGVHSWGFFLLSFGVHPPCVSHRGVS